MDKSNSRRR